jgi:NAD(P)H-hydrate epimerase
VTRYEPLADSYLEITITVPSELEETAIAAAALCGTLGAWCERPGIVRAYFGLGSGGGSRSEAALAREFRSAWREVARDPPPEVRVRAVAAVDWLAQWRETARPVEAAPGLWIAPPGAEATAAPDRESSRAILIQPGQGFGTGSHPTTRALLRWLAADPPRGAVLDVGTGSGVLALAALALGASWAVGLELDEAALENAAENRALNHAGRLALVRGSLDALRPDVRFHRVLANLDRATLDRLLPELAGRVAPGGRLGIAGLLNGEESSFLALALELGLELVDRVVEADPATGDPWWSGWLAGSSSIAAPAAISFFTSVLPLPGPRWCLTPDQIAAVDRAAIEVGLSGAALMETAGRSVAEAIRGRWPGPGRAVILVGAGSNGGDGLVVARHLAGAGWHVELALFADPASLQGDAATQWGLVAPLGLAVERIVDQADARATITHAVGATCVVDALLGTGLRGDVREPMKTAIRALGGIDTPVVAVDAPSGLDGASGRVMGAAVRADLTVTFGFPKPGLLMGEGPELAGRLVVTPLGYPPAALAAAASAGSARPIDWIALDEAEAALPPRRHDLHKGAAGRLLVLAGSEAYSGAAVLTATAALRSGAGICVVATTDGVADRVLASLPEAIAERLPADRSGAVAARAADRVTRAAQEADAVAMGPGLTVTAAVRRVVEAALATARPAVVDADALNAVARGTPPTRIGIAARGAPTILTPHPGELGRWLDRSAADVDRERIAAAREAAVRWDAIVVLKGSPTVVADPGGGAALNLTGNPGLATGGSGDVLTGLIGALLAQGVPPLRAARAGALLHGLAADWARADLGERGLVPSDLFRYLPLTVREVSAGRGAQLLERLDHRYAQLLLAAAGSA